MRPVLNRSNPLELNALFIQPTRWCGLDCAGCYVKEHAGGDEGFHTPAGIQVDLFHEFFLGRRGSWANQITISIDDLPKIPEQQNHLSSVFQTIISLISSDEREKGNRPEVHMTFNTPNTLKAYAPGFTTALKVFSNLDMISFSHIPAGPQFQAVSAAKQVLGNDCYINYNHLVPSNVTSLNIDRHIKRMTEIGKIVDHIYMVIFKSPVGKERDKMTQIGDASQMRSDITYINTMMERLPESVRSKVSVDGCLQDTIKHSKTGFGCSSNVSRVQVWPDGSVTGCPYAFHSTGPEGRTLDDILRNVRRARTEYDFKEKCHLPNVYDFITKRQPLKIAQI